MVDDWEKEKTIESVELENSVGHQRWLQMD